ncbi:MAG: hypothetical protein HW388_840 [Dehalococcoidia bacterium]|nr:hypothetical protein [Dehalococcoidia bacterium]
MQSLFERIGHFIAGHTRLVAVAIIILVVLGVVGASRIEMSSGVSTMVNTESEAYRKLLKLNDNFGSSQVVLLVSAEGIDPLLQPDNLRALDRVAETLRGDSRIASVVNPVDAIRQALGQGGGSASISDTAAVRAALLDPSTGAVRGSFAPLFPQGSNALFVVTLASDLDPKEQMEISNAIEAARAAAGFTGVSTLVTGFPAVSSALEDAMVSSLRTTLLVAMVLMLVVLAVLFPVRSRFYWRWLALGSVFVGTIYAFGAMGWAGQALSIGSLTVFPIIVGLGVDYGIQFHNRYDEEFRRSHSAAAALAISLRHIGSATGLAVIAVILGGLGLLTSSTPIIRDFALTLMFGVVAAWAGAFLVVPTVLFWHYRRRVALTVGGTKDPASPEGESDGIQRLLQGMGHWVVRHPLIVLPLAVLLTVGGFLVDGEIGVKTSQEQFLSPNIPAVRGLLTLQRAGGGMTSFNLIVEADNVARPDIVRWVDGLKPRLLDAFPGVVVQVSSYADAVRRTYGETLPTSVVNDTYSAANVSLMLTGVEIGEMDDLAKALEDAVADPPAGATVTVSGFPLVMAEVFDALTSGRLRITILSIAIIFGGLLLLYRLNPLKALFATAPMVLIVGWASGLMWAAGIDFSPLTATIGALVVGIGAEFGILVLARYYEALERGISSEDAMVEAVMSIGRAIIASGVTAMAGFGALLAATDFPILQDFGLVTAINIGFSIIAALVVMPAMVVLIHGRWLRWRSAGVAG